MIAFTKSVVQARIHRVGSGVTRKQVMETQ